MGLFCILTGSAVFYCLLSGVWFTADCLSEEKREGTLGLLFLTDLKGYDVVLGKLVATSAERLLRRAGGGADPGPAALVGRGDRRRIRAHGAGGRQHPLLLPRARDMRLRPEPLAAQGDGHDAFCSSCFLRPSCRPAGPGDRMMAGTPQVGRAWLMPSAGFSYYLAFDLPYNVARG